MRYYTIQTVNNNYSILTANNKDSLTRFYDNVFELPEDYAEGKYIVGEKEIEIDVPDYETVTEEYEELVLDEEGNAVLDEFGNPIYEMKTKLIRNLVGYHTETKFIKILTFNPDYQQEQAKREQEHIMELSMTRSDFFDGTIRAFNINETLLKTIITNMLDTLEIDEMNKMVAINNYENALHFYRKHPLFSCLSDVPIQIDEKNTLQISAEQWNKFFFEASKKNPNAWEELIK